MIEYTISAMTQRFGRPTAGRLKNGVTMPTFAVNRYQYDQVVPKTTPGIIVQHNDIKVKRGHFSTIIKNSQNEIFAILCMEW